MWRVVSADESVHSLCCFEGNDAVSEKGDGVLVVEVPPLKSQGGMWVRKDV